MASAQLWYWLPAPDIWNDSGCREVLCLKFWQVRATCCLALLLVFATHSISCQQACPTNKQDGAYCQPPLVGNLHQVQDKQRMDLIC